MHLTVLPADSGRCLRWLLLALLFLGLARPVAASHLRGGEARYRYLDATGTTPGRPFRYELTFSVYYNCDGTSSFPCGRALIGVSVFAKTTGLRIDDVTNLSGIQQLDNCPQVTQPTSSLARAGTFPLYRFSDSVVTAITPPGCNILAGCALVVTYQSVVELPTTGGLGYSVMYSENARNNNVTNIAFGSSGASPQVLQIDIPRPTAAYINTSPVFSDSPVPLICSVDTVTIINNAFDAEGDRLLYSFYAPFGSPANLNTIYVAPAPVSYNPRYSFSAPFGPGGYATINPATGQTRYYVPNPGEYVVGVQVTESRTIGGVDVVLSSIYREIQLQVKQCGIPGLPTFPPPTLAPAIGQSISIAEGESIPPIVLTGAALSGGTFTLSASSPLLDGAGAAAASFNNLPGTAPNQPVTLSATAPLTATFRYTAGCGSAGTYNVNFKVSDLSGCPVKETPATYLITVRRPAPATAISGAPTAYVGLAASYTAVGAPVPPTAAYQWAVPGGTVQGSATNDTVSVRWATQGAHTVSVRAATAGGCPSDSVVLAVFVRDTVLATGAARAPLAFTLLPNPTADGHLTVRFGGESNSDGRLAATFAATTLTLTVRSVLGQVVARRRLPVQPGTETPLDLSALPHGVYSVQTDSPTPALRGTTRLLRD